MNYKENAVKRDLKEKENTDMHKNGVLLMHVHERATCKESMRGTLQTTYRVVPFYALVTFCMH